MALFGPNVEKLRKNGDVDGLVHVAATDRKRREAAWAALEEMGPSAVDPLLGILAREDPGRAVSGALALIGDPAVDGVASLASDVDSGTNKRALETLYAMARFGGVSRAFAELREVAKNHPSSVARAMAQAMTSDLDLHVAGRIAAVCEILDDLEQGDEKARLRAAVELRGANRPTIGTLIGLAAEREAAKDALVLVGSAAIPRVVDTMKCGTPATSKAMAHVLILMAENKVPGALDALKQNAGEATDGMARLSPALYEWYRR